MEFSKPSDPESSVKIPRGAYQAIYRIGRPKKSDPDTYVMDFELLKRVERGVVSDIDFPGEVVKKLVPQDGCFKLFCALSGSDANNTDRVNDDQLVGQMFLVDVENFSDGPRVTQVHRWGDVSRNFEYAGDIKPAS